jgi:hypothetical protein
MKKGKDCGGLRKENSVGVKMLSSYKLFSLSMRCELNQQSSKKNNKPVAVYIQLYLLMIGLDTPETYRG